MSHDGELDVPSSSDVRAKVWTLVLVLRTGEDKRERSKKCFLIMINQRGFQQPADRLSHGCVQ